MTWTYSEDPSSDAKDAVRFLIGDTDETDPLLQDEEIVWLISEQGGSYSAGAAACRAIAAKVARQVETVFGALMKAKLQQKHQHYLALATELESQGAIQSVSPWAGAISEAWKETKELEDDRVQPLFTRDLHDYPQTEDTGENS